MSAILEAVKREPAILGAAVLGTADAIGFFAGVSGASAAVLHGVTLGWIAWGVRMLSVPGVAVDAAKLDAANAKEQEIHAYLAGAAAPAGVQPPAPG